MWCAKKKDGLRLIEPNSNLSEAYLKKAEEALESMGVNIIKDWRISTAYYTIYFSLYSILIRVGIKCEIHSCTIEFVKQFLKEYFTEEELKFLGDSLKARIDSQYYIDRTVPDQQYHQMIQKTPEFLVKCKSIVTKINEKKINEIRKKFQDVLTPNKSKVEKIIGNVINSAETS